MCEKTIGEILSMLSSSVEVVESSKKSYKSSVKIGIIRFIIQGLAYMFLGGMNGLIITIMALIRHILLYYKKFSGWIVWIWISISACMNLIVASRFTDLFPLIGTLQYTIMVKKQNTLWLKYAMLINTLIWSVYHIAHLTYIYLLFDVILLVVTIIRIRKGVEE